MFKVITQTEAASLDDSLYDQTIESARSSLVQDITLVYNDK